MKNEWQLDAEELSGVRKWLKEDSGSKQRHCPFYESLCKKIPLITGLGDPLVFERACKPICFKLFKNLGVAIIKDAEGRSKEFCECPCWVYESKYVVRVARLLLARKGLFGDGYRKSKRDKKRAAAAHKTSTEV